MPLHYIIPLTLILSAPAAAQADRETANVVALDREWLLAYNQADAAAYDRIWADDALLVSTQGRVKTKAEEREDVTSAQPPELKAAWTVTDQNARCYGDTIVVIGRFAQSGTYKDQPFTTEYRYTNVYTKLGSAWKLITSQFAPIGPPKG